MKKFFLFFAVILAGFLISCSDGTGTTISSNVAQLDTPSNLRVKVTISNSTYQASDNASQTVYIEITWNPVPYATEYAIYYSDNINDDNPSVIKYLTTVAVNAHTDTFTYTEDGDFYYYVMAMQEETDYQGTPTLIDSDLSPGVRAQVNYATCIVTDLPAPTLEASNGTYTDMVLLTWNIVQDPETSEEATSYRIYRSTIIVANTSSTPTYIYGDYELLTGTITVSPQNEYNLEFEDTTALGTSDENPQFYAYKVVAVYSGTSGEKTSGYSNADIGYIYPYNVPLNYIIDAPSNVYWIYTTVPTNDIVIEWDKVVEEYIGTDGSLHVAAASYDVYRAESQDDSTNYTGYTRIAEGITGTQSTNFANRLSYTDTATKEQGKNYRYAIKANATAGTYSLESSLSGYASAYIAGMPTSTITVTSDNNNDINIAWTEIENTGSYALRYVDTATADAWAAADRSDATYVTANSTLIIGALTQVDLSYYWTGFSALAADDYYIILITTGDNAQTSVTYSSSVTR